MCYLVAKKFNEEGSYALEIERGKRLAGLSKYLTYSTLDKDIQIITVSDIKAYREYEPYRIITNEIDFIKTILVM